jgi:uncharacterized protein YejL (UPF0352 family)
MHETYCLSNPYFLLASVLLVLWITYPGAPIKFLKAILLFAFVRPCDKVISDVRNHRNKHKPKPRLRLSIVLPTKGTVTMNIINGSIPATWSAVAAAAFEDAAGVVRPLASTPVWSTSDESVATVIPAADGLTATITGVAPGTAAIRVSAEADPTPGKNTLTGEVDITVINPEDTQVVMTLGEPTPPAPVAAAAPAA